MPALRPPSAARAFAVPVLAALALVSLVLVAGAAPAYTPPPSDSTLFAHLLSAHIEPQNACPTDSVWLVVADSCSSCLLLLGDEPTGPDNARVSFRVGSAAACAMPHCGVVTVRIPLGRRDPGLHFETVTYVLQFPADSLNPAHESSFLDAVGYVVRDTCSTPPPPPPGTLPFVTHVAIGNSPSPCDSCPPHVCAGTPVEVHVSGLLPGSCYTFRGVQFPPTAAPIDRPVVGLEFELACAGACSDLVRPFAATFTLPAGMRGPHALDLAVLLNTCPDTVRAVVAHQVFPFVTDSCGATPPPTGCVYPFLDPLGATPDSARQCDLVLAPGGTGGVLFGVRSTGGPLAGLQGTIAPSPNLHLLRLETVGPADGMHLVTRELPAGAWGYVLYSDSGAPIPGGDPVPILRAVVRADSLRASATDIGYVAGSATSASDSLGNSEPVCPITTLVLVAAHVCIVTPASCDANHDGVTNVADLVRMARCWLHPETCPDSLGGRPDCNGDGVFGVADIFCCARTILGGSPADTGHAAAGLSLSFGTPTLDQGIVHVNLEIHGASAMNGALLRVRYPADRYAYLLPASPMLASGTGTASQWLPLTEAGDGDVVIGVLKLDDAAPDVVAVPLAFRVLDGQSAGGTLAADQGQVIAPDGSSLAVDLGRLTASLPSGSPSTVTRVELLCGPNPAAGSTRFVVRLPQGSPVDLGLFDLAGRRVETLYRGSLAAGETAFTWQPRGAHGGIYFARLSVNGVVRTTRVTLRLPR